MAGIRSLKKIFPGVARGGDVPSWNRLRHKFYCFYQQFDTLNKLKLLNSQPEFIQRLGLGVGDELAVKCAIAKLQEPQSVVGRPEARDQDVSQRELSESPAGENYEGWYLYSSYILKELDHYFYRELNCFENVLFLHAWAYQA